MAVFLKRGIVMLQSRTVEPKKDGISFLMDDKAGRPLLLTMADGLTAIAGAFRTVADAAEIGKNVEVDLDRATLRSAGSFLLSLGAPPQSIEEDDQPDNAPATERENQP